MKIPVHSSKNRIVYGDGSYPPHWTLGSAPGWLGSGVNDKNGREIFEGDILAVDFDAADKIIGAGCLVEDLRPKKNFEHARLVVVFCLGRFNLVWRMNHNADAPGVDLYMLAYITPCVEVVGHVAESPT